VGRQKTSEKNIYFKDFKIRIWRWVTPFGTWMNGSADALFDGPQMSLIKEVFADFST
jgi:hypothetical protein